MPALLRSATVSALLLLSLPAWAGGVICEPPHYRADKGGPYHELCEIQAAASRFLDQQNIRHKTDWQPLGPDIRMVLEPCLVPLRANWAIFQARKSVMVSCGRAGPSTHDRKWKVAVEIFSESMQPNYYIHKAASDFVGRENARRHSKWKAGYPGDETMVPKCVAPLAVEWRDGARTSVDVICRKATRTTWGKGEWRVKVPVEPMPAI